MASDLDKFKIRASTFSHYLVSHFRKVLSRYTETISLGRKDKDPTNVLVDGLGRVFGVAVGAAAGILMPVIGLLPAGTVGTFGASGLNYLHNKFSHSKRAKTVVRFVNQGTIQNSEYFDAGKQEQLLVQILVEAALHIFEIYEAQFMKIADEDLLRSLEKLAYDAACRAVSYIVQHSGRDQTFSAVVLIKGVLLGDSKKSMIKKLAYFVGSEGQTVKTDTHTWNTAELFGKIAVLANNRIYAKKSLDKSMGARLPADLSDFEPCDSSLESWLQEDGFEVQDWTMDDRYSYVASPEILTEVREQIIRQFEKKDWESILQDLKIGISEINAKLTSTQPSRKLSFKPIPEPHAAFTGRKHFVNSAVEYLSSIGQPNSAGCQIQFPCLVIHALGGYGKTQTARKIASQCKRHDQHCIWIDSCDEQSIFRSFLEIMKQAALVPSDTKSFDATNIKSFLHNFYDLLVNMKDQRFLLIFDNVEDFQQILDYLPLNYAPSNIAVLMTSQRQCQIGDGYGFVKNEPLDLISPEEGVALLEKVFSESSMDSAQQKEQLVERSGRIPLILHLMASTIKFQRKYKPEYTIEKYLLEITHEPIRFKDRSNKMDLSYGKSLSEIIQNAVAKIDAISSSIGQIALKLFDRLAFCSPTDRLDAEFLDAHFRDLKEEAENVDCDLPCKMDDWQIIRMAFELLSEFSLVQLVDIEYGVTKFVVHRLVQESRRLHLVDAGLAKNVLNKAMAALLDEENPDVSTLSIWYHAADFADLTNKYYDVKGNLMGFTFCGAIGVVKKIMKTFGLNRSVRSIFARSDASHFFLKHKLNSLEIAIRHDRQEMLDLFVETIRAYKQEQPEEFKQYSHAIHESTKIAVHYSSQLALEQLFTLIDDLGVRMPEYFEAVVYEAQIRITLWLMEYVEKSRPDLDLIWIIENTTVKKHLFKLFPIRELRKTCLNIETTKELDSHSNSSVFNRLHLAAVTSDLCAIDSILARDPILLESKTINGLTPLMCAVFCGQLEATKHLLEKYSADINAMDYLGYTSLSHAICNRMISMVKFLTDSGAKSITKANSERTVHALHEAVRFWSIYGISRCFQMVVAVLTSTDCDVDATDDNGNNVLHLLTQVSARINFNFAISQFVRYTLISICERQFSQPDLSSDWHDENFHGLISSLLAASPMLVDVRNNDGFTPLELTKHLRKNEPCIWSVNLFDTLILHLENDR